MSENNPLQVLFQKLEYFSKGVQTHLSHFFGVPRDPISGSNEKPFFSGSSNSKINLRDSDSVHLQPKVTFNKGKISNPVTKEELGRATWTFLHTLAAQMAILSRMYPCKDCADHFKEILRENPVQVGSQPEFSQWLCHVHNVVNRSLGKLVFPCERVDARWGKLECEQRACDLQGDPDRRAEQIRFAGRGASVLPCH
ncbi:FAD-linked sulfhydryl oxidase ERV1 isoform X2 [Malania oleifera]|uniref:FAD-linked sulfhydryl oxidase ERV1 isoform X2 n=1 Tax=Malania oleifera TaxID=397392 RepID=UPI0025AE7694|nr:FAD-linked sulfhydryl oxidase ERV1 isoform X2 [Malania oleifera]